MFIDFQTESKGEKEEQGEKQKHHREGETSISCLPYESREGMEPAT